MMATRHKYGAVRCREQYPTCPQGHASLKEHRRAQELQLLEKAGAIRGLREQVRMPLCAEDCVHSRRLVYVADFVYDEDDGTGYWRRVVEDAKGVETPAFRIKRHLLADQGVEVRLV